MAYRIAARGFRVAGLMVTLLGANAAMAQRGSLHGVVVDSAGKPVAGVEVSIPHLGTTTRTDSLGRLTFSNLPLGRMDVSIRRLGYHAQAKNVAVFGDDSVRFVIEAQPVPLAGVDISASGNRSFLQGFDQRRQSGVGTFLTREQIDAKHANNTSDLFRMMPAVRLVKTSLGMGVRFNSNMTVRGRGNVLCVPTLWLDGQKAPGMEVDDLRAQDIEAIELYRGAATTPPQYTQGGVMQCGAIIVWTRRRG
jgi:iron complex outermembrane receptor protein